MTTHTHTPIAAVTHTQSQELYSRFISVLHFQIRLHAYTLQHTTHAHTKRTLAHTSTSTYTWTHAHTRTHTTHIHTHTHTHTHTVPLSSINSHFCQTFLKFLFSFFQVREIPEDFFVDIISRNNFLTSTLRVFFSNLENLGDAPAARSDVTVASDDVTAELQRKGRSFKKNLEKRFGWDFSTEDEEDAPVIVDL